MNPQAGAPPWLLVQDPGGRLASFRDWLSQASQLFEPTIIGTSIVCLFAMAWTEDSVISRPSMMENSAPCWAATSFSAGMAFSSARLAVGAAPARTARAWPAASAVARGAEDPPG